MNFKFEGTIVNSVVESLIQYDIPINYSTLYNKVKESLQRNLSHRDFNNNLKDMTEKKLVIKKDETAKRGSKVYYILSEQAKKKYQLRILGVGYEFERRKSIYQLLLYFDVFKRSNPLTKRQLDKFLKKIGVSDDRIIKLEKPPEKHIEDSNKFYSDILDTEIQIIGKINGVEIVKYREKANTNPKDTIKYYTVIPGFTINEFILYIEKLRKHRDPRPFSNSPPLVPHIHYTRYTKD